MNPLETENSPTALPALQLNRNFWSEVAPRYDRAIDLVIGAEARAQVLARLARQSGWGEVVEFGCGTGCNTRVLADYSTSVVATDLSPGMLAIARTRVPAKNVTFREADCQSPGFADASFDTAVLGLVLHFVEPAETLREMRRIVRPGGRLVIVNPGLESLGWLARFGCRCRTIVSGLTRFRRRPPRGLSKHLLARHELVELLRIHGFKSIQVEVIRSSLRPFGLPIEYLEATA